MFQITAFEHQIDSQDVEIQAQDRSISDLFSAINACQAELRGKIAVIDGHRLGLRTAGEEIEAVMREMDRCRKHFEERIRAMQEMYERLAMANSELRDLIRIRRDGLAAKGGGRVQIASKAEIDCKMSAHLDVFPLFRASFSSLIPSNSYQSCYIEAYLPSSGPPETCQLHSDLPVPSGPPQDCSPPALLAGLPWEQFPGSTTVQIHIQAHTAEVTLIPESTIIGKVTVLAENYAVVTCHGREVAFRTEDSELRFGDECELERRKLFFTLKNVREADRSDENEGKPQETSAIPPSSQSPVLFPAPKSPDIPEPSDSSLIPVGKHPRTAEEQRVPIQSLKQLHEIPLSQTGFCDRFFERYSHWRRSRSDGNSYYRSIAISYLEYLCRERTDLAVFRRFVDGIARQTTARVIIEEVRYYKYALKEVGRLLGVKSDGGSAMDALEISLKNVNFDRGIVVVFRGISLSSMLKLLGDDPTFVTRLDRSPQSYFSLISTMGAEASGTVFLAMAIALEAMIVHTVVDAEWWREDRYRAEASGRKVVMHLLCASGEFAVVYPAAVGKKHEDEEADKEYWEEE